MTCNTFRYTYFFTFDELVAVFKYPAGKHNLFEVNATAFENCAIPPPDEAMVAINGISVLLFLTPGREWYLCGVGSHCKEGQKLAITILPAIEASAPAPSSANGIAASGLLP